MDIFKNKINYRGFKIKIGLIISFSIIIIFGILLCTYNDFNKKYKNVSDDYRNFVISHDILKTTGKSYFPNNVFGVMVHNLIIPSGKASRPGTKRKIKYIIIHETGNFDAKANARSHANYLLRNSTSTTSWHYTVDDKEIYHHIPDNEEAYHSATKVGNLHGIGIELCVNKDGNFEQTFDNGAKLVAYLIKRYNLNIYDILTHHDFSGKNCPYTILRDNRMDEFKERVKFYLK